MKFALSVFLITAVIWEGDQRGCADTIREQTLSQAVINDSINPVWLTQPWDEKVNRSYVAKAAEVEALLPKTTPATLLKKYQTLALQKPTSSLAIFPWVYARYRLVESQRVKKPLSQTCEELYKVLVMAPPPPSAEYTRLRFKVEARTHLNSRLLKVGEKLTSYYKSDSKLLSAYNRVIASSGDLEVAVRNDYLLVKKHPKQVGYRFNLGMDLTTLAWKKRDSKLLDQGETQFNLFDKLAPPDDPLRQYLPNAREYIRLKRLRFAGKKP